MNAAVFDPALAGRPARLVGDDGRILPVAAQRWLAPAHGEDDWLLDRCTGPTVDLGCGPGRLVAELAGRGVPALGVDCSHSAVRQCHSRGAPVLRRDVFAPLPGEGRWHHVLLAAAQIGLRVGNRHCGGRCFIELRSVAEGHVAEGHVAERHVAEGHIAEGSRQRTVSPHQPPGR